MKPLVGSHTLIDNYENCPHKAWRKYILRDLPKFEPSEQMLWGRKVHEALDKRISNGLTRNPLPENMVQYEPFCAAIDNARMPDGQKIPIYTEHKIGIRKDGSVTSFFGADVWFRGTLDVGLWTPASEVASIFDWKTGKTREDAAELEIHALLLRCENKWVQKVTAHYVWLPANKIGKPHDVSDAGATFQRIHAVMSEIEEAIKNRYFPKRQNPLCGFCDVKDCEFNRNPKL